MMDYSILILLLTVCAASHSAALYCEPQICLLGVWDTNQCKCVNVGCPITRCGPNQILNRITCQCQSRKCTLSCSSPKVLNSAACRCECPNIYCPYPKFLNQRTCNCDCPPRQCPYGTRYDWSTCTCRPSGFY